jgi:beta-aspartyl-peptidase (threonine type)
MKRQILWLLVLPIFLMLAFGMTGVEKEIARILDIQKASWNRGDIDGFMKYYWKSEEFTFQSGSNRLRGWQALYTRYQTQYSGENMGKLDFSDILIKVLSDDVVMVLGRWEVQLKTSKKGGLFTTIFQRMPEGWRIIHDHTS